VFLGFYEIFGLMGWVGVVLVLVKKRKQFFGLFAFCCLNGVDYSRLVGLTPAHPTFLGFWGGFSGVVGGSWKSFSTFLKMWRLI
jgi:hypothetical protein